LSQFTDLPPETQPLGRLHGLAGKVGGLLGKGLGSSADASALSSVFKAIARFAGTLNVRFVTYAPLCKKVEVGISW
jgi:hypothetical protein